MDEVGANSTKERQASALLGIVREKQDLAFYVLIDALRNGNPELAYILEKE